MIGEALALDQDGQEGLGAGVDEAALLKEVRIDVIEEQSGPRGHIHQLATLRREIGLAAESSGQFTFEGQRLASGHRSAVNRLECLELNPGHRGSQPVPGAGLSGLHAWHHDGTSNQKSLSCKSFLARN